MIYFLGKFVGALGGYFSGLGIAGAVIGLIVGHFVDEIVLHLRNIRRCREFYKDPDSADLGGDILLPAVTASIICSFMSETGREGEKERETAKQLILRYLRLHLRETFFIQRCIDHLAGSGLQRHRRKTLMFVQIFRYHADYSTRFGLARLLLLFTNISGSGEKEPDRELPLLLSVFETLELRPSDTEPLLRQMEGITRDYRILGVNYGASSAEIKRRFRHLAARYHPDCAAGRKEEETAQAEKKFIEIKEAYDNIMKSREKQEE